jgi:phosphoserine phosphatase
MYRELEHPRMSRGLEMNRCVAFGDSMLDYLFFNELKHTVAINGDPTLRALARYCYEGLDLLSAFVTICNELVRDRASTHV